MADAAISQESGKSFLVKVSLVRLVITDKLLLTSQTDFVSIFANTDVNAYRQTFVCMHTLRT